MGFTISHESLLVRRMNRVSLSKVNAGSSRIRTRANSLRFGNPPTDTTLHMSAPWLLLAAPVLFATLAVILGKEAGWDFQNYHWYNPFALLNERFGFDIAVGHHATYYNPFADVPFYVVATYAPAWVAGAYLGALFGVVVTLIGAIAYHVMPLPNLRQRLTLSAALALAAALGGGALPTLGNTSNDVPSAIGIFAALLVLVMRPLQRHMPEAGGRMPHLWILAGIFAGASVGLKLTNMIYALGLCAATCAAVSGWNRRLANLTWLGLGMAVGFILFGGYWTLRLWQYGANPVFPYFNHFFQSPLLLEGSYRDLNFHPRDAFTAWLFPFLFTANSRLVAEWDFRDAHIAALYVLLPLTALIVVLRRPRASVPVAPRAVLFLFVFAAVSYVAWLLIFSIYRYLIPLEMLAPVLIAAAIMLWPLPMTRQFAAVGALLIALQLLVRVDIGRLPWDRKYIEVDAPQLADPQHTLVLMSGLAPMAYVIPAFPKHVPFLRIDGWLVFSEDRVSGLAREMRARVTTHTGPLYLLYADFESERADAAARNYGLMIDGKACAEVRSNIAEPLKFCALKRA